MLFILIGDDKVGKTTLQKILIDKICYLDRYAQLKTNLIFPIIHPEIKRKYKTISFGNRSYQEKEKEYYKTIDNYFRSFFKDADIAFISSHLNEIDIREMITKGRENFFNVFGVFFTNSITHNRSANQIIAQLEWNERLIVENPWTDNEAQINNQLYEIGESIVTFISNRTSIS